MGLFTSTAFAEGCSAIAFATSSTRIPSGMPRRLSVPGFTYTGIAPHTTSALMALRCTLRGRMISSPAVHSSPAVQVAMIIACTAEVVPLTMKNASSAPNASAARRCASRITETGCPRLSSGFMELTSIAIARSPRYSVSSGLPRPLLCAGTSKCARRLIRCASSASASGVARWRAVRASSALEGTVLAI